VEVPIGLPCQEHASGYCPDAPPEQGTACAVGSGGPDLPCDYDDGLVVCFCEPDRYEDELDREGDPGTWGCFGPPDHPGCPVRPPNLGEGCSPVPVDCTYFVDTCYTLLGSFYCFDGAWGAGGPVTCGAF
jgi:hypothetical protein